MKITLRIRAIGQRVLINAVTDDAILTISDRASSYALTNAAVDVYDAFKMFLSLNPKLNVVLDIDYQQLHAVYYERSAQTFVSDITDAVRRAGA